MSGDMTSFSVQTSFRSQPEIGAQLGLGFGHAKMLALVTLKAQESPSLKTQCVCRRFRPERGVVMSNDVLFFAHMP